jgi:hypothetical protein
MPLVVQFERVAAMYAGPRPGLGLGSHAGQGTRHGPKSVLVSDRTANNPRSAKHMACNSKQRRLGQRINYFLKLTQPSSILAIAAVQHDRGVIFDESASQRNPL